MSPSGNRITTNAFNADDGRQLIQKALAEIKEQHGWYPIDESIIFSGIYYDSTKVGSFITRATNNGNEKAVIKLQLRPLPYDEGFIIKNIQQQINTPRIRLPKLFFDTPWNEKLGYGFLIMEDLSHLPHLWPTRPNDQELNRHQDFLNEFMHQVLPLKPFLSAPQLPPQEQYRDAFQHFEEIAKASNHHHIDFAEIDKMKDRYFKILESLKFDDFHFTHGHLSGHEIIFDQKNDCYILFANLLWSYRPTYYELIFPIWVDLMAIRDTNVNLEMLLAAINRWMQVWNNIQNEDLTNNKLFWFSLLERSILTTMLDLGSSEWHENETKEKQALLNAWKNLYNHISNKKFSE